MFDELHDPIGDRIAQKPARQVVFLGPRIALRRLEGKGKRICYGCSVRANHDSASTSTTNVATVGT